MKFFQKEQIQFYASMLLSIILIVALIKYTKIDFITFKRTLFSISTINCVLILAYTWLFVFTVSLRWGYLVKMLSNKKQFSKGFFFYYYALSIIVTHQIPQILGNIGVKTLSLKYTHNIGLLKGTYTVLLEHIYNIIIILIMGIPSMLFVLKVFSATNALILTSFLSVIILIILNLRYKQTIISIFKIITPIKKYLTRFSCLQKHLNFDDEELIAIYLTKKKQVITLFCISMLVYASVILRYYAYADALNMEIPFLPFLMCFPIVYIIGALGITPGAFGIAEFGWLGVLMLIGIDKESAAIYVIGQRILNIASILIIFLFSWIFYLLNNNENN